jgi:hypothetical protein
MLTDPAISINKTIHTGQLFFKEVFFLTKLLKNQFYYPLLFDELNDIPGG